MPHVVATFYKFVQLPDFAEKREPLLAMCLDQDLKGTILLAEEGINGTITGSRAAIDHLLTVLKSDSRLADLEAKESVTDSGTFDRMKVKLKKEIVTLGLPEIKPSETVGTYVAPKDWNAVISDPEVRVIDVRNDYEVGIGSFVGAENPQTDSFREFPEFVRSHLDPTQHKKVAMFCTGGIRCEKASSYMLAQGFEEVYHLQGGILKYLEEVPAEESLWEGECFVFDQRVAVTQGVQDGSYAMCFACGHPVSPEQQQLPEYEEGVSCPYCAEG